MEKLAKDALHEMEGKIKLSIEVSKREMGAIRTGRASTTLLEGIKVDYYGTDTPLNQMANIVIPEAGLIVIQPWDKGTLGEIEKAIQKADIGLTPNNDGQVIRLSLPPLSEERRKELFKIVKKMAEEGRVAIRAVRHKSREKLKELEKEGKVSKDESHKTQEDMEKLTHKYIEAIDKNLQDKEKEILEG